MTLNSLRELKLSFSPDRHIPLVIAKLMLNVREGWCLSTMNHVRGRHPNLQTLISSTVAAVLPAAFAAIHRASLRICSHM